MIEIGHIYRFVYQEGNALNPKGIVYGLVTNINGKEIEMFSLNGFTGIQYLSYDVMKYKRTLIYKKSGEKAILDHQESDKFYNMFKPYSHYIVAGIFKNS